MTNEKVVLEFPETELAIIRLGTPEEKEITLGIERLTSLEEAVHRTKKKNPKGLIITGCSDEMFASGLDIALLVDQKDNAALELSKNGQELCATIASLPFPTVAAISGECTGAAYEIALACRYRLLSDHKRSVISINPVKSGVVPCFGATQRLPRMVGAEKALCLLTSGRQLRPKEALEWGLVDEVVTPGKLLLKAEKIALGQARPGRKRWGIKDWYRTKTSCGRKSLKISAAPLIGRESKNGLYPAVQAIVDLVLEGLEIGEEAGYRKESELFSELVRTPQCRALVRLFFLTESAKSIGRSGLKHVQHPGALVVGSGLMGSQITALLASHEYQVILKGRDEKHVAKALSAIRASLDRDRNRSDAEKSFIMNRIETTLGDSPNITSCGLAIEAVSEDLETKKKVLKETASQLTPDTIIATNTSSLSVSRLAETLPGAERVIGMHFFNPAAKMRLLEIVRGEKANARAVAIAAAAALKLNKIPIVVEDKPGFLVNRILFCGLSQALKMLAEGWQVKDIDRAAVSFGFPMGPLMLLDEIGLETAQKIFASLSAVYGKRIQAAGFLKAMVERGRTGKKSGVGFYNHTGEKPEPASDLAESAGLKQQALIMEDFKPLAERYVLAMVNEAVRCLDEGIAGKPGSEAAGQVDLATVYGFGFPSAYGGILSYADSLGAKAVLESLLATEKKHGPAFTPCDGVKKRAGAGLTFIS